MPKPNRVTARPRHNLSGTIALAGSRQPEMTHVEPRRYIPMNLSQAPVTLLICSALIGCAHKGVENVSSTMFLGAYSAGGITYYPAHPGTTNYGVVDFTTNPPPTGAKDYVVVVTTNGSWKINVIDEK